MFTVKLWSGLIIASPLAAPYNTRSLKETGTHLCEGLCWWGKAECCSWFVVIATKLIMVIAEICNLFERLLTLAFSLASHHPILSCTCVASTLTDLASLPSCWGFFQNHAVDGVSSPESHGSGINNSIKDGLTFKDSFKPCDGLNCSSIRWSDDGLICWALCICFTFCRLQILILTRYEIYKLFFSCFSCPTPLNTEHSSTAPSPTMISKLKHMV